MEVTETLPVWKKELISHRKQPGLRTTSPNLDDDIKSRRCPEPSIEPSVRAADIIKFFNRVADAGVKQLSAMARRPTVAYPHLAAKPGNTADSTKSEERNATLASPYAGTGSGRGSPTRHGRVVSHPSPSSQGVSRVQTLNLGTRPDRVHSEKTNARGGGSAAAWLAEEAVVAPPSHQVPRLRTDEKEEEEEQGRVTLVELWSSSESENECEPAAAVVVATTTVPSSSHRYPSHPAHQQELMGEEKRLFLSNGGGGGGGRSESLDSVRGGVGARLRNRQAVNGGGGGGSSGYVNNANKRNLGRGGGGGGGILITAANLGGGGGDSDGMMGSGGESDSSEEIHYGPGFVSRLKSRYMSVALRGTARGSLGSLRRTASLEDFLEIDKCRPEESLEEDAASPLLLQPVHFARNAQVRMPTAAAAVPSLKVNIMPVVGSSVSNQHSFCLAFPRVGTIDVP